MSLKGGETEKKTGIKKPSWIKMKPADLEKVVIELAKKGETPARIGIILRDNYGIPKTRVFGKRIEQILKKSGLDYVSERKIVEKRVEKLKTHVSKNKKDYPASRAIAKRLWVLHNLES